MFGKRSISGGIVALGCIVLCSNVSARADVLLSLASDDVATTYEYPDGGDPGHLVLNDTNLGVIATFSDVPQLSISDVELTLSVDFIGELGDTGDEFAHGGFGGGMLTLTDLSGGSPGQILFQAQITEFELEEITPGAFVGSGVFTGAAYGGVLTGVNAPLDGQLITSLFTWREIDPGGAIIDIDTFETSPGVSTIFADMHDVNIVPEPGSIIIMTMLSCALTRRRRAPVIL